MGKIRLIGLDLDGTLLDGSKKITKRSQDALERAAQEGVYLEPITGRPHEGIPGFVPALPYFRYFISCNGAAIRDGKEGRMVRQRLISPQDSHRLGLLLTQHRVPYEVLVDGIGYSEQWIYDFLIQRSPNNSFLPRYIRETRRIVPSLEAFLAEGKGLEEILVMSGTKERQEELLTQIQALAQLHIVFPAPSMMELTAKDVNKGEAMLSLAASLGIEREEVMAIGDSGNDLEMLRAAGLSVAMGNASPEVKEKAKFITASNEEDGVARAIERFVL